MSTWCQRKSEKNKPLWILGHLALNPGLALHFVAAGQWLKFSTQLRWLIDHSLYCPGVSVLKFCTPPPNISFPSFIHLSFLEIAPCLNCSGRCTTGGWWVSQTGSSMEFPELTGLEYLWPMAWWGIRIFKIPEFRWRNRLIWSYPICLSPHFFFF